MRRVDTRGLEGGLVGEVPTVRQRHGVMPTLCKNPNIRGGNRSQDISVKRVGHRGDARSLQRGRGEGGGAKRLPQRKGAGPEGATWEGGVPPASPEPDPSWTRSAVRSRFTGLRYTAGDALGSLRDSTGPWVSSAQDLRKVASENDVQLGLCPAAPVADALTLARPNGSWRG